MFNTILFEEKTQDQPKCNCQQKGTCLLEGNCLDKKLICQCNLKKNTTSDGLNYNGLTENTFKDRFCKHRNSFNYESKKILQNYLVNYKAIPAENKQKLK